jgi:hypothetical protein
MRNLEGLTMDTLRKQIHGEFSTWHPVTQGSVLGPVLFALYINDLPEIVQSKLFLFADDAKVSRRIDTVEDTDALQGDLDNMEDWADTSQMTFHPAKCTCMSIHCRNQQHFQSTYSIAQSQLKTVTSERDLWVMTRQLLRSRSRTSRPEGIGLWV